MSEQEIKFPNVQKTSIFSSDIFPFNKILNSKLNILSINSKSNISFIDKKFPITLFVNINIG